MLKIFNRYQKSYVGDPSSHPFYQDWGQNDQVFCATTRKFSSAPVPSVVSLRLVLQGSYWHHSGNVPVKMDQGACLVADSGRPYAVQIDSKRPVTTVEVHYSHETVRQIGAAVACPSLDAVLDSKSLPRPPIVERVEQSSALAARLAGLAQHLRAFQIPDLVWVEDQVHATLAEAFSIQTGYKTEWTRIDAARPGTRLELYRRLVRARDYLRGQIPRSVSTSELADVATLSPYHFQRLYRQVFGTTVHHDVTRHRLNWAQARIRRGCAIKDVALDSGFAHASSFCRAFRKHFGHSPTS